jgi:fluoroacetyl-CoA thioesterase
MKPSLIPGLKHAAELTVTPGMLVPGLAEHLPDFHGMPPVFATAMMVGFVEATCIDCLRPHLDVTEHSVGTHLDMSHVAPTPVGKCVRAEVELVAVEGRALTFKVAVHDEAGKIGQGQHQRAVILIDRFMAKVADRSRE